MDYFDKPGINYCKKDRKTHRYFDYKYRPIETVHKVVIGGETLSKKKKLKLYNSTNDDFMPGVNYSLNKARNWDTFKSSAKLLDKVASNDSEYSVAMVKGQRLYSERHPSDNAYETTIFRYRCEKLAEKQWHSKITSIVNECEEEVKENVDEDFDVPCTSHQTNLTFGDCFIKKSFQNNSRRKSDNNFEKVTLEDPACDKIKKRPKVIFDASLAKQNIESMVFSYNKNSISSLNFQDIKFMYDLLWLNKEKTKCLFIIPKSLGKECSKFDSFMILEFFGGKKKRLRVTTNSIHKKATFPSDDVCLNLKTIIIKIWRTSVNNSEINDSVKRPPTIFPYQNALLSAVGTPVGDFDLLFKHQPKFVGDNDYEILTFNNRCNICNYKNATVLNCSHSYCLECATKMIKNQIENYADKLCCNICSMSLDPIFIFVSTPLLLLRSYLRSKYFQNKDTVKCPNCNDVLLLDEKDARNIKCAHCSVIFCRECKESPHFPLPCSKMNQWKKQMLKQTWFTYYGDFDCTCKQRVELSRYHEYLEYDTKKIHCLSCPNQYVLSWPQMELPKMLNYNKTVTKFFEIDSPHFITDSVASITIDAFTKRKTMTYQNKMVQKIVNFSSVMPPKARAMIAESLLLLEYGTSYIYFKRKNLTENDKLLKHHLHSLRSVMIQMETCGGGKIGLNKITVQFILSNARYFFLPIASLFDFLHSLTGISEADYRNQKYFILSLHSTLMFIIKLIIGFAKDMYFIMSNSLTTFQRLIHGTFQINRYDTEEETLFILFDNEVLPIISAIIYVLFFMTVLSFEYIIERSMQSMKYEYFITDTENYMREIIRLQLEKAQQKYYPDPSLNQYPPPHLTQISEVDVEME
uniref:IBR domain-containing protein n=1 Tax=Panagrolaimus sp. ES5 TaxID=591445 RepID=A0AC34GUQ7_9BILA